MIIQERISNTLVKTYSDKGVYIHGGFPEGDYEEAVDPISLNRTYTETDIPIVDDVSDHEALNILLGRSDPIEQDEDDSIEESDPSGE